MLIKRMSRAIRFPAGSSVMEYNSSDVSTAVTAAVATDRALVLGAQALADVYGNHYESDYHYSWFEQKVDHDAIVEISISMMGGKGKVRFNVKDEAGADIPTDHGVITVDSYAPAVTG